jgi:ribose 1,5-bisphosphokinase PhnN
MQDKKKKKVRFSFDVLRGDIINRVALQTKLLPRGARNSRYITTCMIRSAQVTRKMYGRSAIDNLGSLHQQARRSCSSLQYYLALATKDLCQ